MDALSAALLVRAMASQTRVAAMEAENQYRISLGQSLAYGEEAFLAEADVMDNIATGLQWRGNL